MFAGARFAGQHAFEFVERFGQRRTRLGRLGMGHNGLPAVSGRNKLRRSQMIELDEHYVRTMSFRQDLRILLKTIPIVLLRHGSSNDVSEEFIEDI